MTLLHSPGFAFRQKAALPAIKKLQDEFGPQGFQVVSITSYYGYFGAKQGVAKTDEFSLMHGFVKDFNMTWPVAFDEKQLTHSKYHVGAIPHMVLIDRKGVIRRIEVGHTEEGEAATLGLLKKLLAEGA